MKQIDSNEQKRLKASRVMTAPF